MVKNGKNDNLSTMLRKVQNKLHDMGKQQIVFTFNNGTGGLKFLKNQKPKTSVGLSKVN